MYSKTTEALRMIEKQIEISLFSFKEIGVYFYFDGFTRVIRIGTKVSAYVKLIVKTSEFYGEFR